MSMEQPGMLLYKTTGIQTFIFIPYMYRGYWDLAQISVSDIFWMDRRQHAVHNLCNFMQLDILIHSV